jgi:hypothetical protein
MFIAERMQCRDTGEVMQNDLPIRKNIRLLEYDYSQTGYYFITMCVKDGRLMCHIDDVGFAQQRFHESYLYST